MAAFPPSDCSMDWQRFGLDLTSFWKTNLCLLEYLIKTNSTGRCQHKSNQSNQCRGQVLWIKGWKMRIGNLLSWFTKPKNTHQIQLFNQSCKVSTGSRSMIWKATPSEIVKHDLNHFKKYNHESLHSHSSETSFILYNKVVTNEF